MERTQYVQYTRVQLVLCRALVSDLPEGLLPCPRAVFAEAAWQWGQVRLQIAKIDVKKANEKFANAL